MTKKVLSLLLLSLILCSILITPALASMNSSLYINSTTAYISRSGGSLTIHFDITGNNMKDYIGATKVYLYEKTAGTWYLVKTYSYTDYLYTDMMKSNSSVNYCNLPFNGSATKNYYATVVFYAERSGGSDSYNQDTSEV